MNLRFLLVPASIFILTVVMAHTSFCEGMASSINVDAAEIQIENRSLRMRLAGEQEGMRIKSIVGKKGDIDFIASQPSCRALWKLTMHKGDVERTVGPVNIKASLAVEDTGKGKKLTIKWARIYIEKGSVQVTVQIVIADDDNLVRMRIKVDNESEWQLAGVIFPYMSGVGPLSSKPESDILVWPGTYGCGKLVYNPYKNDILRHDPERFPYPAAFQSMQFTCLYNHTGNGGLYFGAYDPKCNIKSFWYEPESAGNCMAYFLENLPENMNMAGNDYDMPYDAVIGTFSGDWWDAVEIYRNWALKQSWCRQTTVMQDTSVPEPVKQTAMWVHLSGYPEIVLKDALEYKKLFGLKFILHYYQWHQIPFDSFYPDYFPPKQGFENTVEKLQKENIAVMPYINVRLWNVKGASYTKENAQSGAVWDKSGKVVTENYGHIFAVMLPCSKIWQNKIASICNELAFKYNVEGIYLDQLSAVGAIPSYNTREKTSGGGNYWVTGYWEMLDRINAELKDKPTFLTSESFTESYISRMSGGFLVWVAYGQNDIPLAQAVYGGKTVFWGRAFGVKDLEGDAYYAKLGDMLVKGIQIGWLFDWLLKDNAKEQREYTIRMAKMYDNVLRKAFLDGHMIRPPLLEGVSEEVESNWAIRNTTMPVTRPAVLTGAWQCSDGETLVLLMNISKKSQTFSLVRKFVDSVTQNKNLKIWSTENPEWKPLKDKITVTPRHAVVVSFSGTDGNHASCVWDMKKLSETPQSESAEEVVKAAKNVIWKEGKPLSDRPALVKAIWLKGEDYKGKPTKIFAWVGVPKTANGKKVPGMVLVHGGGGTAFAEWVAMWNRRGYAAIAIDTSGHTPCAPSYGKWLAHKNSGPQSCGDFANIDEPVKNQWTYHAVSAVIRAHSYLLSLPQVDSNRTGITGMSWGGYLTCIAAGVDSRFKVIIPVYGCGFLGENSLWAGILKSLGDNKRDKWLELWDPSVYVGNIQAPILWVAFANDTAYPMDSLKKTCKLVPGRFYLCVPSDFGHSHECGWSRPEISDFADSVLRPVNKISLPVITGQGRNGNTAWISFEYTRPITRTVFCYTKDSGPWPKRKWQTFYVPSPTKNKKIDTTIPKGTTAYYFNILYAQDKLVSSQMEEIVVNNILNK